MKGKHKSAGLFFFLGSRWASLEYVIGNCVQWSFHPGGVRFRRTLPWSAKNRVTARPSPAETGAMISDAARGIKPRRTFRLTSPHAKSNSAA
jgi:hypothetical protein